MPDRRFFVGIDIGGTFTDVVVAERDAPALRIAKKLTTPNDPALGVKEALLEALASANAAAGDLDRAVHATTLATNVILEGRGARVAYVTDARLRRPAEQEHRPPSRAGALRPVLREP